MIQKDFAGMMELVDMRDLGSRASGVGVRVPMPAPRVSHSRTYPFYFQYQNINQLTVRNQLKEGLYELFRLYC